MFSSKEIRTEDYQYNLPERRIASYPLKERDSSKLLVYNRGVIDDDSFRNIGNWLDKDHHLFFNNTRVIRARLLFKKPTGASIEIFCLEPVDPADFNLSFASSGVVKWKCLIGNLKKWKNEKIYLQFKVKSVSTTINAELLGKYEDGWLIQFSWDNDSLTFCEILEGGGHMPIPPYLNRADEKIDNTRYQTVYSKARGSVAAPTAGLHFTSPLIETLTNNGILISELTLHISAGTFIPVKSKTIGEHKMHSELFSVTRESIESFRNQKIVSVGTTTVRTIESLYWLGSKIQRGYKEENGLLYVNQWEPYESDATIHVDEAIDSLLWYMDHNNIDKIEAQTSMIIVPGYNFRFIKGLITNWHMPGSTLLMLVAAFIGKDWKRIYRHALDHDYRFLSYGDSSLLLKQTD
ncbi:MAG TPA: S-adenosylmethionine:tRNA ribosyltransferase-isomerase [Bacteroidales bacterium]|nr:S-adenosylmethionine:tRNA ribosyltransferase-isomerase [Bacteroidales bacterium]